MTTQTVVEKKLSLGLIIYAAGFLLGLGLTLLAIWGDLEAALFDTLFRPEQRLTSLSCPVLMTTDEEASIRASFTNGSEREENLRVRARVTQGFASLIREEEVNLVIPPGGEDEVTWRITADDAAWDRIVMARVSTVRSVPYRQLVGSSCGVLVLPVSGVTGGQIVGAMLVFSLLLTILGGWLWQNGRARPFTEKERKTWRLMILFAVITGTALAASLLQLWLLGMVLILILLLLAISATEYVTTPPFLR